MNIIKQLKFGDISRIAVEMKVSAGYVQTALRGGCESDKCKEIRDYAKFIVLQYEERAVYLKSYCKSLRS
jgi:hypothetical protein